MPMHADEIAARIKAAIPDAQATITDLAGDGDHYAAHVTAKGFAGLSRIAQQRLVYAALGTDMGTTLHALQLTTAAAIEE